MTYKIIHIQGNTIEDVTGRMEAIINIYIESGWELTSSQLIILMVGTRNFACMKEIVHK